MKIKHLTIIAFIGVCLASCQQEDEYSRTVRENNEYLENFNDSIDAEIEHTTRLMDCQIDRINAGVIKEKAKCDCEKLYGKE